MKRDTVTVKCGYCGKVNRATPSQGKTRCAGCGRELFGASVAAQPIKKTSRAGRVVGFVLATVIAIIVIAVGVALATAH